MMPPTIRKGPYEKAAITMRRIATDPRSLDLFVYRRSGSG
jgi:hypothetical protein